MGLFVLSDLQKLARENSLQGIFFTKSAETVLNESIEKQASVKKFDIFLSHAFADAEIVLGIKLKLESYGKSVYVDWVDDPQLNRSEVNVATAKHIKERMHYCSALFYATTESSFVSKWMPWGTGYFDGIKNKVAILPVTEEQTLTYKGQEYLGLYPYAVEGHTELNPDDDLLIVYTKDKSAYYFEEWLKK